MSSDYICVCGNEYDVKNPDLDLIMYYEGELHCSNPSCSHIVITLSPFEVMIKLTDHYDKKLQLLLNKIKLLEGKQK